MGFDVAKVLTDHGTRNSAARWLPATAAILAVVSFAAYANSFSGPFFFDSAASITDNPTIRHLWPIGPVLSPLSNGGLTVAGRPMVNLSFAINYALGGMNVGGYHALNLAIHILATLTLFGIVRRSFQRWSGGESARLPGGRTADPVHFAFGVALLWAVHPLQTESVTYVVQRAESLMGLFYLLTLYGFIRGVESRGWWYAVSIVACLLGMATKEVMASAPLVVFLYDRTFISGTFREAWNRRKGVHIGLASTWLLLGYLMASAGERGGSAGFGLGVSSWHYLLTQCRAVVLYLKLSVWPHPLVFDYGTETVTSVAEIWPQAILLCGLLAGTAWALVHRPVLGFIAAWFFVILAPTSSVAPVVTQTIAEHRMYLPLAAVATLAVIGIHWLAGRRSLAVLVVLAAALCVETARRNRIYDNEGGIWTDVIATVPGNPRAHNNLGLVFGRSNKSAEAITHYEAALRLKPDYAEAHDNLANELAKLPGRVPDAIAHYEEAVHYKPGLAEAHNDFAVVLAKLPGRGSDAIAHYAETVRLKPEFAEAHVNFAAELAKIPGREADAIAHYEEALRLKPGLAEVHNNLANLLVRQPNRQADAIAHYEEAIHLKPDYPEAHNNLANLLAGQPGRQADAIAHYEEAIRLKPDFAEAYNNLSVLCAEAGRLDEAIGYLETALKLDPHNTKARDNLEIIRAAKKQ